MRTARLVLLLTLLIACSGAENVDGFPTASGMASGAITSEPGARVTKAPPREDATLPPRESFFGNPERGSPRISPDGRYLAFLAPDAGVLNVWVGPPSDIGKAKVITKDR